MTRNEEIAWAAGFFDGEGCMTTMCPKKAWKDGRLRRYFRISLTQNDPRVLERFARIFPGGGLYHSMTRGRDEFKYQVSGKKAFPVVCAMWPYLDEQKKADFKRACKQVLSTRKGGDPYGQV